MTSVTTTRHDILKTLALALMLVDHLGFFLFPDQMEWRAIGRASAPIWLFLVGYNRKSTVDLPLMLAAAMMLLVVPLLTGNTLPINILATIILVRVCLPVFPILLMPLRGFEKGFVPGILLGAVGIAMYPTDMLWEYGAFAFIFAGWGWWQREREDAESYFTRYRTAPYIFAGIAFIAYAAHYIVALQFDVMESTLMVICLGAVATVLARFHAGPLTRQISPQAAKILHFCGRQSLLLYVAHYVLLGLIRISLQ